MKLLITFHSISEALLLEAAGKERGWDCALVPAPRALSSSCGYAAVLETCDAPGLASLLREVNAEWEALWRESGGGYEELCRNG